MTLRLVSRFPALALPWFAGLVASGRAGGEPAVYPELVAPVIAAKCAGCHGAEKQKGRLRMDSLESLLKGGSEGPAVVPGDAGKSLMLVRMGLPEDDDERMPPPDEAQLTEGETQLLRKWVEKGASPTITAGELGLDEALVRQLLSPAGAALEAPPQIPVATVDPALREKVIAEVQATGASLMPVAQDTPLLRFSALSVAERFGDEELKSLAPVAADLMWLDLARTKVTNQGLALLADMKNLTRLHLEKTGISDEGLVHLGGLSRLEYLNLYHTGVTDQGLAHLQGLKNLKKLYLWQSRATPGGTGFLRRAIPGLVVNLGWEPESKQAGGGVTDGT